MHMLDNGICRTCQPEEHYLVDGSCEGCSDAQPLGEDEQALVQALHELDGPVVARGIWDEAKHPRGPGGKFRSNVDRLKEAITKHRAGNLEGHPFDGFSREQLRRVAKARGIELKRGESHESISDKLIGHLGHEQAVETSGRKEKVSPEDRLRAGIASGVAHEERLSDGNVGTVHLVTFGDGSKAIRKTAHQPYAGRSAVELTDNEHLVGELGRAIGAPVPAVIRTGATEVHMEYVDHATSGMQLLMDGRDDLRQAAYTSDDGRRIGLLDQLTFNGDRHGGNWLRDNKTGRLHGIDHGMAWPPGGNLIRPDTPWPMSEFGEHYATEDGFERTDLTPADYDWVISQMETLRPAFAEAGRTDQLNFSIERARHMRQFAGGTTNRIKP